MDIKDKDTYGYKSDVGFISNTFQITHHIDLFSRTNEAAIHDQTDRLEAIILHKLSNRKLMLTLIERIEKPYLIN